MTDKEIADQVTHLRVKANMLRMGERIAFGSDSYALECAAETIERLIRERAAAVHLGKAGAYKANPEYTWAEWAADRQKELDVAEARVAELEGALRQADEWFRAYAQGHYAKGDWDKAKRNHDRADYCNRAALGRDGT